MMHFQYPMIEQWIMSTFVFNGQSPFDLKLNETEQWNPVGTVSLQSA